MKAFLLGSVRATMLATTLWLLGVTSLFGSSSFGGPPARPDTIKWREKPSSKKKLVQKPPAPAPADDSSSPARTRYVWITPASPKSANPDENETKASAKPTPVGQVAPNHQAAEIGLNYGDVLNAKQKAILQERAEALGIQPGDYARLLTDDEKLRLDEMLADRRKYITTAE